MKICNCDCDIYEKLKKLLTEGIDADSFNPPVGYNPIEKIRNALFLWAPVPFFGNPIWMKLRSLNMIELKSCGNISCLYIDNKSKKELSIEKIVEIKKIQENIVKESLVFPIYDEIIKVITEENFILSQKEKQIEQLKKEIEDLSEGKEKREFLKQIRKLELSLKFILPDDTTAFITSWELGIDKTDIKKLSRQMLLNAAILAVNGKNNPSDHISGVFTDFQRDDINNQAWIIFREFQEDKKREKELQKKGYQVFTKKVV